MLQEFKIIYNKLDYLADTSKVHADNLAKSSVPGAKAKDIEPFKVTVTKSASTVDRTHEKHITPGGGTHGHRVYTVKPDEVSNSGNGISPESELMALNEATTQSLALQKVHNANMGVLKKVYGIAR